jgi:hypothetical protein
MRCARSNGQPLNGTHSRASKSMASSGRHWPDQRVVEPPNVRNLECAGA